MGAGKSDPPRTVRIIMATTWIKSLHIGKKRARSSVIADIIDYAKNPEKTDGGRLISAYACDSRVPDGYIKKVRCA